MPLRIGALKSWSLAKAPIRTTPRTSLDIGNGPKDPLLSRASSVATRIERQPEVPSLKVAPRGKNGAENATFSLRLVN
jgi:hypothetical protein